MVVKTTISQSTVSAKYLFFSIVLCMHVYTLFSPVPPPTLVVQPVNPSIPMVAGTARDLTCTINITNVDDIIVMVNFTWSTQMEILLTSLPRITTISGTVQTGNQSSFTSTLSISPLDSVVDTTAFICLVSINSDPSDNFVIPTTANNSVDITVQREYLVHKHLFMLYPPIQLFLLPL